MKPTNIHGRAQLADIDTATYVSYDSQAHLSTPMLLKQLEAQQVELEIQNQKLTQANELLSNARIRYIDLYDNAPVAYITLENKAYIQNINMAGTKLLGESRAKLIGTSFLTCLDDHNQKEFMRHLHEVFSLDGKRVKQLEMHDSNDQKHIIYLESLADSDFPVCRTVIFDITEQDLTGRTWDEHEHQFNLITDSLDVMVAYVNNEERHNYVNEAYCDWFLLNKEEIVGKRLSDIIDVHQYERIFKYFQQALNGEFIQFDSYTIMKNGVKRLANITLIPDSGTKHDKSGFFILIRDINKLKDSGGITERLSSHSTHIARLNTMGEMVSEITHELSQPLSAISIFSETCLSRMRSMPEIDPDIIESLDSITVQAKRATEIMTELRSFVSRKELHKTSADINNVIKDINNLLTIEADSHNALLDFNLGDNLPITHVDTILIQQIIINIVKNAIEAMVENNQSAKHISITSRLAQDELILSIADNGPGVSAHNMKNIFEPFISYKPDGMGMGLAICHSIISAHNGRIWVSSNKWGGATFNFTLSITGKGDGNDIERDDINY